VDQTGFVLASSLPRGESRRPQVVARCSGPVGGNVLTGSLAALRNDACYYCGKSGLFARNCPNKNFDEQLPHYARPGGGRVLDGGPQTFVTGVAARGGSASTCGGQSGVGLQVLGPPAQEFIASIQEQIQLQQGQLLLQTQLLEARELIERQAEMLEHGLRTVAQPAGPKGVRPRTQAGAVNQLQGVTCRVDWGREGGLLGVGFLDDVAARLRDDLDDLAPAMRMRLPSRKDGAE
jgi:hypothetical protein